MSINLSDDNDVWNLIGNPFSSDLDVIGLGSWVTDGNLTSSVGQVYDPISNSYVLSTEYSNKIAAFQGFFIQNSDASSLTIPASALTDDATFFKENENRRLISFQVTAEEKGTDEIFIDRAFNIYFSESSEEGWDIWDATKLTPLSNRYIGLGFVDDQEGRLILKAQESRPFKLQDSITIPAEFFSAGVDGTVEISIQTLLNIPLSWKVEIEDTFTGNRKVIDSESPFRFDFTSTRAAKDQETGVITAPVIQSAKVTSDTPRFLFQINPGLLGDNIILPTQITLNQNYPNPFNPTTVISYELPESGNVTLEVFDMTGRLVATLANGTVQAGSHQINFDASGLSRVCICTGLLRGVRCFREDLRC